MTDFEKVIDFKNMYRAYRKAKCGKGFKKSSARFNLAALDGVNTLIAQRDAFALGAVDEQVTQPAHIRVIPEMIMDDLLQLVMGDAVEEF